MVKTREQDHSSRWAASQSIASKIGRTPEPLRSWIRKIEVDAGGNAGVTSEHAAQMKTLERETRELKKTNEILRKAATFFAQSELDRKPT